MKTTITIVCDKEVPPIHLLNSTDYEVVETKQEGVFCMIKKELPLAEYN